MKKMQKLQKMSVAELEQHAQKLREKSASLTQRIHMSEVKNHRELRELKRELAQTLTSINLQKPQEK